MDKITTIDVQSISDKIHLIRDKQVILDSILAELYGIETKRINEAVKNNPNKFPADFYFELYDNEFESLRSNFSTTNLKLDLSTSRFTKTRTNPKAFTEKGLYMLATILHPV